MDLLIHDSCDVIIENKRTGKTFMTAESQLNTISGTLGIDETVFGGIGVRPIAKVRGQKEITTNYQNALYNKETLAATQGVEVKQETLVLSKLKEGLTVSGGSVTLDETLAEDEVTLRNTDGEILKANALEGVIEVDVDFADEGEIISVAYKEEVQGQSVDLRSDTYSEAHKITYHTIAYDRNSVVKKDIYIVFYHAIPSGEFELALEMGTPIAPETTFDIMVDPGTSLMGKIIEVDRVNGEPGTP